MRWVALAMLAAGCSSSPQESSEAHWVLRVGTPAGLEPMGPTVTGTMTANLVDLVYQPLSKYFDSHVVEGSTVRWHVRAGSSADAGELARWFTHPELLAATASGDEVVARFRSEEVARSIGLNDTLVASGPYRVEESRHDLLSLTRKVPGDGPPKIEVVAVDTEDEEWRRVIAGEFDLAPQVVPGSIYYLRQIPELRVVPIEIPRSASLWFNLTRGPTARQDIRQAIAAAIRRRPLTMSVFGSSDAALAAFEDLDLARTHLAEAGFSASAPLRLQLVVHEAQSDLVRAALVLQQQLAAVDVVLDVHVLPVDELMQRVATKDFELLLFFGDTTDRFWSLLHSAPEGNFIGYASAEFDAAADAKDQVRAKDILTRDVPLTPLFGLSESVVIRRRFCNVHPRFSSDYTWMADVRLCAPGEED